MVLDLVLKASPITIFAGIIIILCYNYHKSTNHHNIDNYYVRLNDSDLLTESLLQKSKPPTFNDLNV